MVASFKTTAVAAKQGCLESQFCRRQNLLVIKIHGRIFITPPHKSFATAHLIDSTVVAFCMVCLPSE